MKRLDAVRVPLEGTHLVEASAGTGKTHAITTLYLRAVIELGLLPEKILVVTFTRAATSELRERIRTRLRHAQSCLLEVQQAQKNQENLVVTDDTLARAASSKQATKEALERLAGALLVIDDAAVMTIHGFCARVLEGNAFDSRMDLSIELIESTDDLIEELLADFVVTKVSTLPLELLASVQARGLGIGSLRALARIRLACPSALVEPRPIAPILSFGDAIVGLEAARALAIEWLRNPTAEGDLGRLQKTKRGEGIGPRLLGYLAKSQAWLRSPHHGLKGRCEAFGKLRDLADKNTSQMSTGLQRFLDILARCDAVFDDYDEVIRYQLHGLRFSFASELPRELERRMSSRHVQSYDDLLKRLRDALASDSGSALATSLRKKYPLALVDEFQDTDPVQYEVFSKIYSGNSSLFMIGDPKQSIYAFRGADIVNYQRAVRSAGQWRHTLDVNYRSDPSHVAALDKLYAGHFDPFCGADIEFVRVRSRPGAEDLPGASGVRSGVSIVWAEPANGDGRIEELPKYAMRDLALGFTVRHVESILCSGAQIQDRTVRPSDVAVLTRTNRECGLVAQTLRNKGIRCIETSDGSVLESEAAGSLRKVFRALLKPSDKRALATLMLDPIVSMSPRELADLQGDELELERWVNRLARWMQVWSRSGALTMVLRLMDEIAVPARLLRESYGERWVTNLQHAAELVQTIAARKRLGPKGQLNWLERASVETASCSGEELQLRVESDAQAVFVTTIHRSKGLQYPFVVCPFLWDSGGEARLPEAVQIRRTTAEPDACDGEGQFERLPILHLRPEMLDADGPELKARRDERRAESARLLYVAMTRAKHHAAVVIGPVTGVEETALYHLLFRRNAEDASDLGRGAIDQLRSRLEDRALRIESFAPAEQFPGPVQRVADGCELHEPSLPRRVVSPTVHTTSYSALTANATGPRHQASTAEELPVLDGHGPDAGRDVDANPLLVSGGARAEDSLREVDIEGETYDARLRDAGFAQLPLSSLPRGAKTGEAIHTLFETIDFGTFSPDSSTPDVISVLQRFGVEADIGAGIDVGTIRRALCGVIDAELVAHIPNLRLRRIERLRSTAELEFMFELRGLNTSRFASMLVPDVTGMDAVYSARLAELDFAELSGYLRGFIDLVFELDGRIYVVDYKSNALGDSANDYRDSAVKRAMMDHHYPIQAALYAAAVDSWLQTGYAGYEYEKHFGGVLYLFVRGMHSCLPPGAGVYFHRPTEAGLSRLASGLRGGVL